MAKRDPSTPWPLGVGGISARRGGYRDAPRLASRGPRRLAETALRLYRRQVHFRVQHDTLYRYDVPVTLSAHVLRLTPRPGPIQLTRHRLVIEPEPMAWIDETDAFDNSITRLSFGVPTQTFRVTSEFELETLPVPELDARLDPLPHGSIERSEFAAYQAPAPHPNVRQFAAELAVEVGDRPIAFLDHLTRTLYTRMDRHVRPSGDARPAHETLALGSGACRDLTVLFLEACRAQGLVGRFVSGYQAQAQTPDGQRHLHAWAEVFLDGLGWRAWDATHGVRVTDGHVALCAAPSQAGTMPIEGGFFFQGAVVNSTLDHSVRISTRSSAAPC